MKMERFHLTNIPTMPPESSSPTGSDEDAFPCDYIQNAPKVELHAHLNGCIRETTLFELAKERNVSLSPRHFMTPASATAATDPYMYNVLPRSLQDCFDMFAEIPKCVSDLSALRRITREALQDFAAHHVAYLELRSTPKRLLRSHSDPSQGVASKQEYLEELLSELVDFERKENKRFEQQSADSTSLANAHLPMICRFIVSVDRSQTLEDAQENVDLAISLSRGADSAVVGVDLGGNPTKQDFRLFEPLFAKARQAGLKVTLHCAEIPCGAEDEVIDVDCKNELQQGNIGEREKLETARQEAAATLKFHPDRLGHALLLPPSLRKILSEKCIPVETCPTSNVMTLELNKVVDGDLIHGLRQHATLQTWLDSKHPLAVGTDDPGVFDTTATQELLLLATAFRLQKKDVARIVTQSMDYAFCDETVRNQIRTRLEQRFRELM